MKIEINKEDLKDVLNQEYLATVLAEKIISEKTDQKWNEFDKELLSALQDATKKIVKDYMENYLAENKVRDLVQEELKKMSKGEIIHALTEL